MIIVFVLLYLVVGLLYLYRLTHKKGETLEDLCYPILGVILIVLIWPLGVYWKIKGFPEEEL